MFGIGLAEQLFTVAVSLALVGFGLGILSTMVYLFTSLESSKNDVTLSLAIVSCFSFLGQFTSPIINQFIQDIFGTHSVESTFFISGYIGILAIIIVIVNQYIKIYTPKRQPD
jgi:MFS family permease